MPESPASIGLLALELFALLVICSFGPGVLLVRKLRFSPLEKLGAALAASLILIYLAGFGLFLIHARRWGYWIVSGIGAGMGIAGWRQIGVFLRNRQTRRVLIAAIIVLLWEFLHLAMVRNFDGGDWTNDWREHFDRSRYFMHLVGNDFLFVGIDTLPARPPMMNVLCAFFQTQVGLSFEAYSLCCLFLNGIAFIPCCLLLRFFSRRGIRQVLPLAVLFMLNPSIMENVTWTITKALAAGLVVMGVCFYLRALRGKTFSNFQDSPPPLPSPGVPGEGKRDSNGRLVAAALCLAAAVLVHYSAGPYALAIGLHYLWVWIRRRRGMGEALVAGGAAAALLATWFVFSAAVFGLHNSFFANTTAGGLAQDTSNTVVKRLAINLMTFLVPHPIHRMGAGALRSEWNWGNVRDYYFMMSQRTMPLMIGLTGGIVALILWIRKKGGSIAEQGFWIYFVILTYVLGTLADPYTEIFGGGHVTLQPLAMMGLTLVAASIWEMPGFLFGILLFGLITDYSLGVLLQFDRESYVYLFSYGSDGVLSVAYDVTIGRMGRMDFMAKLNNHYTFWGDHFQNVSSILEIGSGLIALIALWRLVAWRRKNLRRVIPNQKTGGFPVVLKR